MWVDRSPGWFIRRRESQEHRRWKNKDLAGWPGLLFLISHLPFSHLPAGRSGRPGRPSPSPILPSSHLPVVGGRVGTFMSTRISADERRKIKLRLMDRLGAQKIDLLVARDTERPLVRIAQREGVIL